ncbi:MAG TPA: glycoside hydrolase family 3 protein [Candidatus Limnocylindrales bacterium]|nr:glycoside hydrolase family 3 protein [Candidatus Limnocylindrales bacterium]
MQVPEEVLEKFILGFEGHTLPGELRRYLAAGLAGVILYPRNFSGAEELFSLTQEIRSAAGRPVLIGIDQEGGTRFSLPEPFTQWVSPEDLGRIGDPELVERQARAMAKELRAAGVNLDFAPMLDLHIQPESPVTKGRSFGKNPQETGKFGAAFARGLAAEGILACAKHFPGHGDTVVDPHEDLPRFEGTLERLREMELVPFRSAISAGVPLIMTAHISLPQVDPDWLASLSRKILDGILREELKFGGAILADDLGMGAIAKRWPIGEAGARVFSAGSDLALICHDWKLVRPALEGAAQAVARGELAGADWAASGERIGRLRKIVKAEVQVAGSRDVIGCAEHRELVREIRARLAGNKS